MGPDWYRLFLVDVTGHGAQAAMRTMVLQQQLERANKACDTPWMLLATLNDTVVEAFGSMVVNYCALCIDFRKQGDGWAMTGSNAGLPEPTLMQQNALTKLTDAAIRASSLEWIIRILNVTSSRATGWCWPPMASWTCWTARRAQSGFPTKRISPRRLTSRRAKRWTASSTLSPRIPPSANLAMT